MGSQGRRELLGVRGECRGAGTVGQRGGTRRLGDEFTSTRVGTLQ